jgi:hypothetical protein
MANGDGQTKKDFLDGIDDLRQENQDLQEQIGAVADEQRSAKCISRNDSPLYDLFYTICFKGCGA